MFVLNDHWCTHLDLRVGSVIPRALCTTYVPATAYPYRVPPLAVLSDCEEHLTAELVTRNYNTAHVAQDPATRGLEAMDPSPAVDSACPHG
jgi:hypothetical protein